jgi:hypothetical protein
LSAFSKRGEHDAAVLFGEAIFGYGRMASLYTKAADRKTSIYRSMHKLGGFIPSP